MYICFDDFIHYEMSTKGLFISFVKNHRMFKNFFYIYVMQCNTGCLWEASDSFL